MASQFLAIQILCHDFWSPAHSTPSYFLRFVSHQSSVQSLHQVAFLTISYVVSHSFAHSISIGLALWLSQNPHIFQGLVKNVFLTPGMLSFESLQCFISLVVNTNNSLVKRPSCLIVCLFIYFSCKFYDFIHAWFSKKSHALGVTSPADF